MNKITTAFCVLVCLFQIEMYSQSQSFEYENELCECKASFDSSKYTKEQLRNTLNSFQYSPGIDTDATAWSIEKVKDLDVEKLKNECSEVLNKLNLLDIVDDKFWLKYKSDNIKYIESTCKLREITIQSYSNPEILMSYDLVDDSAIYYRKALISGGDDLLNAWIYLNEIQKSRNGSPDRVQARFDRKYNSSEALSYAKIEIMQYGWWNSANRMLPHLDNNTCYSREFEKLFIKTNCECVEP